MTYIPPNPNGQATMANSTPVVIASDQSTIPVSVSGVATAANQTTGNTSLSAIDTDLGTPSDAASTAGSTGSLNAKARLMTSQLDAIQTSAQTLDNAISGNEMQVDVVTLPASTPITASGSHTGTTATALTLSGQSNATFQLTGTWTATVTF